MNISRLLVLGFASALVCCVAERGNAFIHRGNAASVPAPVSCTAFPLSYYQGISGGWPCDPNKFPIGLWYQTPDQSSGYYNPGNIYPNLAAAAAAAGINVMIIANGGGAYTDNGFGVDTGQLQAVKDAGLYAFVGNFLDYTSAVTYNSVQSELANASRVSAQANMIGYVLGDEPGCGSTGYIAPSTGPEMGAVPAALVTARGVDPNRMYYYNLNHFAAVMNSNFYPGPGGWNCPSGGTTEFDNLIASLSISSYDEYPEIDPYFASNNYNTGAGALVTKSDFIDKPVDILWGIGVGIANLRNALPTHPVWGFVAASNDAAAVSGSSGGPATVEVTVTSGSSTVTNVSATYSDSGTDGLEPSYVATVFTTSWVGLKISGPCIPANTYLGILLGTTTMTMTQSNLTTPVVASCSTSGRSPSTHETATISGGDVQGGTQCQKNNHAGTPINLCVTTGTRYREIDSDVFAEVWNMIINGAYGIEWFCHDYTSASFCLGDSAGGAAATAALANMVYTNGIIQNWAPMLQVPHDGICSMQAVTGSFASNTSCSQGTLTLSTGTSTLPALAMVNPYNGKKYLFVQTNRRSPSSAGAAITVTVSGQAGKTATLKYDSRSQFDSGNALPINSTQYVLNGSGAFTVTMANGGQIGDDYNTMIFEIT